MAQSNKRIGEKIIEGTLFSSAFVTIAVTISIIFILLSGAFSFFKEISVIEFLTDTEWTPTFADKHYGILPLLFGTILTTLIAVVIAVPMGVTIAVYLSLYAPFKLKQIAKPALEVLAAVPTVGYGYFALTIVTPFLQSLFPESIDANNALSAGIVMGIMILPMVSSLSEDALNAVPGKLKEASFGMGATKFQTAFKVVVPSASSGIIVSIILAVSRAIGETMIVTIAAGAQPSMSFNPLKEVATITSYMVSTSKSDVQVGDTAYYAIFAAGITLFLFTFLLNILSNLIKKKFQEKYD